jgi:tetratricopeptide (TPR) repeat protein
MENTNKPKLVFFQWQHKNLSTFAQLHMQQHVKCLSNFFEVVVINEDCDYQHICEKHQPDLTLFESGVRYSGSKRIQIQNTSSYSRIPKLGLHNGDSWCDCRAGFISDMEKWGIDTFFSISITTAEHTPSIAENLFVWPNFIDPEICKDYSQPKTIPVLFNGRTDPLYPWRRKIQKIVSHNYPSLICPHLGYENRVAARMYYGEKYARLINASWFTPSCGSIAKEIVRKHFEIPAAKSCLLTEKSAALEACGFIDMQNCVFADEYDVLDKLDFLFQNQDKLESIINAGYELVHTRHTLQQRDQIFQWFTLYQNLKPHQKIIQISPFEPLAIVEKTSEIKSSHIFCNGLSITLTKQGDEKLWAGKFKEAETLYLTCLNYIFWMPEPRFKLAICKLYQGDVVSALEQLIQLNQYTLEEYKASEPDPVEWAYFIISLLCQGKLDEARKRAQQFPWLNHPELERIRLAINILTEKEGNEIKFYSQMEGYRQSIHQLPNRSLKSWFDNLINMLKTCQQQTLANILCKASLAEYQLRAQKSIPDRNTKELQRRLQISQSAESTLIDSSMTPVSGSFLKVSIRQFLLYSLKPFFGDVLRHLEKRFGYFLPYHLSAMRNDDFFYTVQKMVKEEDFETALFLGAAAEQGTTEAFLLGILENSNNPTVFCMNTPVPAFLKLKQCYPNNPRIVCQNIAVITDCENTNSANDYIKDILQNYHIKNIDILLIDGSGLDITLKLDKLFGVKIIILDDISTFQNHKNYRELLTNSSYSLVSQNACLRNGHAIFVQN